MLSFLASTLVTTIPFYDDENRVCAYIVGIPYASDNFSDQEWERFKLCKHYVQIEQ